MRQNEYRVNLPVFEGPLDLLVYLIKKNDLDVYDIPIAFVLEEFMSYLETFKELNIDVAGEFLLMTAELAHIKSRMLLPEDQLEREEEEPDPRADLVRRLLEYQQYREAAVFLARRSQLYRDVFIPFVAERKQEVTEGPIVATTFDLIEAFGRVLGRMSADQYHAVAVDRVSVNTRIYQLMEHLKKGVTVNLEELLPSPLTRYDVVVTFLALLEMCRLRIVTLYQAARLGALYVTGILEDVGEAEWPKLITIEGGSETPPEEDHGHV